MAESGSKDVREAEDAKAVGPAEDKNNVTAEDKPEQGTAPEAPSSEDKAAAEAETAPAVKGSRMKRGSKVVSAGIAHIRATFNNTAVSISDMQGGVIAWSTAGRAGFKGSRKSTAFAATTVGQDAARQAAAKGMHEVEVRVCGAGAGRESAIRALQSSGLNVSVIKDVTPMPHNGCRSRKRRRV